MKQSIRYRVNYIKRYSTQTPNHIFDEQIFSNKKLAEQFLMSKEPYDAQMYTEAYMLLEKNKIWKWVACDDTVFFDGTELTIN